MKLIVPLPFWTKQAYSIVDDEIRGGWRAFYVRCSVKRIPHTRFGCHPAFGFDFTFYVGFGVLFNRDVIPNGSSPQ